MFARLENVLSPQEAAVAEGEQKFGTFAGVFVPTVLTSLGVIMYLRTGWVVDNAGLGGAILVIILAHVITVSTGLAVSSVVTNTRVGAGGAFAIISQSLGLEVGGGIGVPLYLAQAISGHFNRGAENDLKQATHLVRQMVLDWGMSEKLGHMALGGQSQQVFLGEQLTHSREYFEFVHFMPPYDWVKVELTAITHQIL